MSSSTIIKKETLEDIPTYHSWSLLGHWNKRKKSGAKFYSHLNEQFGNFVWYRLLTFKILYISHPDDIKTVLNTKSYGKGITFRLMAKFFGKGILVTEGEDWLKARQIFNGIFSVQNIDKMIPIVREEIDNLKNRWEVICKQKKEIDLCYEMNTLALRIAAKAFFRTTISEEEIEYLSEDVKDVQKFFSINTAKLKYLPFDFNPHFKNVRKRIDQTLYRLIEKGKNNIHCEHDSILSGIINSEKNKGIALSDKEIRDHALSFFLAGHETTANALSYALYNLNKHPHWADIIKKEEERVHESIINTSEIKMIPEYLPQTHLFINESMRLFPVAWGIPREAKKDDIIGNVAIKKGVRIMTCPFALHRDSRFWPKAQDFLPERFMHNSILRAKNNSAFLPFGLGPRNCIGKKLAMMEIPLILAEINRQFQIHIKPDFNLVLEPRVTLVAKNGIPATIVKN